jgi:hypothetical protein
MSVGYSDFFCVNDGGVYMINTVQGPAVPAVPDKLPALEKASPINDSGRPVKSVEVQADKASMSALSRQLGESAVRAETRDKTLSRRELGDEAERIVSALVHKYEASKKIHNSEVPKTDDPELLDRARLATDFLTRKFAGDHSGKSPFAGLSREQLVLIAYDEKGTYTVNERRVAWGDAQDIELEWGRKAVMQGTLEASVSGKHPKFLTEVLEHYRTLPAIEQARYDEGYEGRVLSDIKNEGGLPKKDDRLPNLFEILAGYRRPVKKPEPQPQKDAADSATAPDKDKGTAKPKAQAAPTPANGESPALKTSSLSPDVSPTPEAVPRSQPSPVVP